MDLNDIIKKAKEILEKEDRKDASFRCLILYNQIGDLGKFITHDPNENPNSRAYGSKTEEQTNYGEAFMHLVMTSLARGIDLEKGIESAIKKLEEQDWKRRKSENRRIIGLTDWKGEVEGISYVVSQEYPIEKFENGILVLKHAHQDIINYFNKATGIVTDEGGLTCHLAVIMKDYNNQIPYIVGTGNATKLIKHCQKIKIKGNGKKGEVYV